MNGPGKHGQRRGWETLSLQSIQSLLGLAVVSNMSLLPSHLLLAHLKLPVSFFFF